jgi:hypothetical protein
MDSNVWIDTTLETERLFSAVWSATTRRRPGRDRIIYSYVSEFPSGQEGYFFSSYNSSVSVGLIAVVKTRQSFLGDGQAENPNIL